MTSTVERTITSLPSKYNYLRINRFIVSMKIKKKASKKLKCTKSKIECIKKVYTCKSLNKSIYKIF